MAQLDVVPIFLLVFCLQASSTEGGPAVPNVTDLTLTLNPNASEVLAKWKFEPPHIKPEFAFRVVHLKTTTGPTEHTNTTERQFAVHGGRLFCLKVAPNINKVTGQYMENCTCTGPVQIDHIVISTTPPEIRWDSNVKDFEYNCSFTEPCGDNGFTLSNNTSCDFKDKQAGVMYNVTVRPITKDTECPQDSMAKSATFETKPKDPPVIDKLDTKTEGSNTTLSWNMPAAYPGPTKFSLYVDTINAGRRLVCEKNVESPCSTTPLKCNYQTKSSMWLYTFSLNATTNGKMVEASKIFVITREGKPGKVEFNTTRLKKSFHEASIAFKGLAPHERRGYIKKYTISVEETKTKRKEHYEIGSRLEQQKANYTNPDLVREYNMNDTEIPFTQVFKVSPGLQYVIRIQAMTFENNDGILNTMSFVAPQAAPSQWNRKKNGNLVDLKSISQGENTLTFKLQSSRFFWKTNNGIINAQGLLVSNHDNLTRLSSGTKHEFNEVCTYAQSRNDKKLLFRVDPEILKKRINRPIEITLGNSHGCPASFSDKFTCNGKLTPNTKYIVNGFACTGGGCTVELLLKASTKDPDEDDDTVAGLIVAVFLVAILVVVLAVLIFKLKKFRTITKASIIKHRIIRPFGSRPIKLCNLSDTVDSMHANSKLLFMVDFTETVAKQPVQDKCSQHSEGKNRFIDVEPYQHSAVLLSVLNEDPTTSFINANYMPGYYSDKDFIATQGPLDSTTNDFWRMVWQYELEIIVMLTNLREGNIDKCFQYWPHVPGQEKQYGSIHVTNVGVTNLNNNNLTLLKVTNDEFPGDQRKVKHFHLLTFQDHSASVKPVDIVQFIEDVRSHRTQLESPMLVHCSAGVGRTGTFIAIDYVNNFIKKKSWTDKLDILGFVVKMRSYRMYMVQTESQYVLIHDSAKYLVNKRLHVEKGEPCQDGQGYASERKQLEMAVSVESPSDQSNGTSTETTKQSQSETTISVEPQTGQSAAPVDTPTDQSNEFSKPTETLETPPEGVIESKL